MSAKGQLIGHQALVPWKGKEILTLEDIVKPDLCVLFFGCNPALISRDVGHYHQGRFGKVLWSLLRRFGFIPIDTPLGREDDYLLQNGLGMTDIVKKPGPKCAAVGPADYEHGRTVLTRLIRKNQPIRVVCSVYRAAMKELLDDHNLPPYGPIGKRLDTNSEFFILPFPPGRGRDKSVIDREFRRLRTKASC